MEKRPRQYPGIIFRAGINGNDKNGNYVCQIYFNPYPNKRVYKTIKIEKKSYREAAKARTQWMAEYMQKHPGSNSQSKENLQFSQLREILIQMMKVGTFTNRAEGCAQRTINKSSNVFNRFFYEFIPQKHPLVKRINDLPKGIFLEYQGFTVLEKKLVWRNEIQALKTIISRFWRGDYCNDQIYKEIRKSPTPDAEQKKRYILTLSEIKNLLEHIKGDSPKFYAITYFLAKLGWRVTETLSIKCENIKWTNGEPTEIAIEKEFRKNRKEFVLETVDEKLANQIKECIAHEKH